MKKNTSTSSTHHEKTPHIAHSLSPAGRKIRRDAGLVLATPRDLALLSFLGHMYAARLDHLRDLAGWQAGGVTKHEGIISRSTLRDMVGRWERAGWVEVRRMLAGQPAWVWLSKAGLRLVGLDDLYEARPLAVA